MRMRHLVSMRVIVCIMAATSVFWMRLRWHIRAASMSRKRTTLRVHARVASWSRIEIRASRGRAGVMRRITVRMRVRRRARLRIRVLIHMMVICHRKFWGGIL